MQAESLTGAMVNQAGLRQGRGTGGSVVQGAMVQGEMTAEVTRARSYCALGVAVNNGG